MKKGLFLALMLVIICLTAGCAGLGDWRSEPLPGGYEVWRCSAHVLVLVKPDKDTNGGQTIVSEEIYAVCYNDEYICIQWEPNEPDSDDYSKEPHGEISYYILPVATGEARGPYDYENYSEMCSQLAIENLCDWIEVKNLPRQKT